MTKPKYTYSFEHHDDLSAWSVYEFIDGTQQPPMIVWSAWLEDSPSYDPPSYCLRDDAWNRCYTALVEMLAERDSSTPQIPSAEFMAAAKDLVDAIETPSEDAPPARDVCAYATPVTTPELRRCSEVVPLSHHPRHSMLAKCSNEVSGTMHRKWRESKEAVVRSRVTVAVRERPFCHVSQTYVDLIFDWVDLYYDGKEVVPQFYCRHCRGGDREAL